MTQTYDYVVIDAMLQAYKSWWPVRHLAASDGTPTGLEFGFIKNILAFARSYQPAKVVIAWDGAPVRCNTIYPKRMEKDSKTGQDVEVGYKSGRVKHEDHDAEPNWTPRLKVLRHLCEPIFTTLYHPEAEADEEIARFCYEAQRRGKRCLIASKDRDLHQLVNENVHLVKGTDSADIIDPQHVIEKWGVPGERVPLRRAIEGDSSDGFRGIPRISKDVIINAALRAEPYNIESLIDVIRNGNICRTARQLEKLLEGEDIIRRNFALSELKTQSEIQPTVLGTATGDYSKLRDFCISKEFKSLVSSKEWFILGEPAVL